MWGSGVVMGARWCEGSWLMLFSFTDYHKFKGIIFGFMF